MERGSIFEKIPINYVLPFVVILILEFLISFGLNTYKNALNNQISNIEMEIGSKEKEFLPQLQKSEGYYYFSKADYINKIVSQRKSVFQIVSKLKEFLPKFVNLESLSVDTLDETVDMKLSVNSWTDFSRFVKYFSNHPDFDLDNLSSPSLSEKDRTINFQVKIKLRPTFYK